MFTRTSIRPKVPHGGVHHREDIVALSDIRGPECRPDAEFTGEFRGGALAGVGADLGDEDVGAFGCEATGDSPSDAFSGTGHDGDLAFEAFHRGLLVASGGSTWIAHSRNRGWVTLSHFARLQVSRGR